MKEALFYTKLEDHKVRCSLCAHRCIVRPGQRGICGVRANESGTLYSLTYQKLNSAAIDPIEKKPLYHYMPGSRAFSICTAGCNFSCLFCQNADSSQIGKESGDDFFTVFGDMVTPDQIVDLAVKNKCGCIAYTYTEPTVFYEYAYETARLASSKEIKNVFITNGYMSPEALEYIDPYLDAVNVDLKAFDDEFYKRNCGARLQPVLDTIKRMFESGIFVELTTLLIPGENDSPKELKHLANWIADLSTDIPWHVSAFKPGYRMQDVPPASEQQVYKALEIGQTAGLKYLYAGNVGGDRYQNTECYNCGEVLIRRDGYTTHSKLKKPECYKCGERLEVVLG